MVDFKGEFTKYLGQMIVKYQERSWTKACEGVEQVVRDVNDVLGQISKETLAVGLKGEKKIPAYGGSFKVFRLELVERGEPAGLLEYLHVQENGRFPVIAAPTPDGKVPPNKLQLLGDLEALQMRFFQYFMNPSSSIVERLARAVERRTILFPDDEPRPMVEKL